jgi:hypothetical protein
MSDVSKICPQCGGSNALDARHCAHCGYDTQSALPAVQYNLPAVLGKAAVPVLAGAVGLAVSVGWKLLQGMLNQATRPAPPTVHVPRSESTAIQPTAHSPRRTIHIRTAWAIGDSSGAWRRGESEQTIEFD